MKKLMNNITDTYEKKIINDIIHQSTCIYCWFALFNLKIF